VTLGLAGRAVNLALAAATDPPLQDAVCPVKTNVVEQPSLSVSVRPTWKVPSPKVWLGVGPAL
jgi:hypothetical protein